MPVFSLVTLNRTILIPTEKMDLLKSLGRFFLIIQYVDLPKDPYQFELWQVKLSNNSKYNIRHVKF